MMMGVGIMIASGAALGAFGLFCLLLAYCIWLSHCLAKLSKAHRDGGGHGASVVPQLGRSPEK